jgi:phage-related protein
MIIRFDPRAKKVLGEFGEKEKSKVYEYISLFNEYGFNLGSKYLKKITGPVWELRPGRIRLFIIRVTGQSVVIHVMYKKSQKITEETLRILEKRVKEYI